MRSRRLAPQSILVFAFLPAMAQYAASQCSPSNNTTIWGGNENVVMDMRNPMGNIRGTVMEDIQSHKPLSGVLVEIYNHPEIVQQDSSRNRTGQTRIIGCVTGQNGRFSFKLKSGDYELRASKAPDMNVTSILIRVRKPGFPSTKHLVVQLFPGT